MPQLTPKQVDGACRKGEKVFATVKGKRRRLMGVNFSMSTKDAYYVSLWNQKRNSDLAGWWSVNPAKITVRSV